jgi:Mrp family chromosome partitioning ATPase
MDLDLRKPGMAATLGLQGSHTMAEFLSGSCSIEESFLRLADNVAVGFNACSVPRSAELLQEPATAQRLLELKSTLDPQVLLFDLPPTLGSDDVLAFLPNVDCVLIVAAAETSTFDQIDLCESTLAKCSNVLGVVLNQCRFEPEQYGY